MTVPPNGQTTLRLDATGTNLTFEWTSGGVPAEGTGANTNVFTTAQLTSSTSYTVKVANECGIVWSSSVTVQVGTVPAVPTGLLASASGTTAVNLTWNAVANADSYIVFRKSNGSAYAQIASNVTSNSYTDTNRLAGATYVYKVRAVDDGLESDLSAPDAVTLIAWTSLAPGALRPAAAHLDQLLQGVNSMRVAGGALETTWSAILPSGSVAPASGGSFDDQHISALRVALNAARRALDLSDWNFTDPQLGSGARLGPRAIHATDIQDGMR